MWNSLIGRSQNEHIMETPQKQSCLKATATSAFFKPVMLIATISILGGVSYGLYDLIRVPEYTCPLAGQSPVEVEAGRRIVVGPSRDGEVCVLEGETVVGRSYDGLPWEQSTVAVEDFKCEENGNCTVLVPPNRGKFYLNSYGSKISTPETEVARFLMQATFGPKKTELSSWGSNTPKTWIREQMQLPPSLHREYFRKRVSQRTRSHSVTGRPRRACDHHSRWHRHAFTAADIGDTLVVVSLSGGRVALQLTGITRVEIDSRLWRTRGRSPFKICSVEEYVGGRVTFGANDCSESNANPALEFSSPPTSRMITFDSSQATLKEMAAPVDGVLILNVVSGLRLEPCSAPRFGPIFMLNPADGKLYQHDSRLVLLENTLESPAKGESLEGDYCVSAPKTFLNKDTCVVGGRNCAPPTYTSKTIKLDDTTLRSFITVGGHYVYKIDGLPIAGQRDPCSDRSSRWLKVSCDSGNDNNKLTPRTLQLFMDNLQRSRDPNPLVRDIHVGFSSACDSVSTLGATLEVSGTCWKHVHKQMFDVYDFTRLTDKYAHLGPDYVVRRPAETQQSTTLLFPESHPIGYWTFQFRGYHRMGRYLDDVDFAKLPSFVQSEEMAQHFGVSETTSVDDDLTERCGSPGEVANDPTLGARFSVGMFTYKNIQGRDPEILDTRMEESNYKTATWARLALNADDQLRQRMAFALSEIVVITASQIGNRENEHSIAFYDIFVRHAFGNYRDILKEVSYSPMMALMLTYMETKSFEYSLRETGRDIFPDENYAREIMQLFTIGLIQLFADGTQRKDENGVLLETYTNEDIIAFSRAWTGFKRQNTRGNFDGISWVRSANNLDPMQIVPEYRDQFPKMDLYRGHIGDGYPLCVEFPEKMFLRKGASWIYRGTDPLPKLDRDPSYFGARFNVRRATLDSRSDLYKKLCQEDSTGKCRFKSTVELDENLACMGIECDADALRTVKVSNAFYEFVRPACVRFPFFNNGKKLQNAEGKDALCVHPGEIVAAEACCSPETTSASQNCLFAGERLSFTRAQQRCASEGKELCDFSSTVTDSCFPEGPHWTTANCEVLIKIANNRGKVAVVHEPEVGPRGSFTKDNMRKSVRQDSRNLFRVDWKGNSFPSPENDCKGICELTEANECLCRGTVFEAAVFDRLPSVREVVENLHIGSLAPDVYDAGEYTLYLRDGDVKVYVKAGGALFDKNTIFKVTDKGEERYFVNMESTVALTNGDGFRNPANLMGIVTATARDAHYETDAVIDHFFKHRNCPPFVAYRIIQRFVTSNPSPRYVTACATAFAQGSYEGFGSGKYGDLAALIAAVLLDKEARSISLDSDPTHGQLREPLLKIIHVLRSLEVKTRGNRELDFLDLNAIIAQRPHFAPDVFSYFKPEYAPAGKVATAGLVAPEAQIFTGPTVVNLVNGLISLMRVGLSNCFSGFGLHFERRDCLRMLVGLERIEAAPAMLGWTPEGSSAEEVVDELNVLLTAGRLDDFTRSYIVREFNVEAEKGDFDGAVTLAKQLLIAAPEFHISNLIQRVFESKRSVEETRNGTRPFKAIVFLLLQGGVDSYNLIVPYSDCNNGKDMYQEYKDVRSDIALRKETLLPIVVPSGNQVCNQFGIHPNLPKLRDLYNQGDALFAANVGPLVEPVTKEEVFLQSKAIPQGLFAHNVQQQAAQTMFPQRRVATGVLGHMNDALLAQGYSTGAFSISGVNEVLEGDPGKGLAQTYMSAAGVKNFDPIRDSTTVVNSIRDLNEVPAESIFADTWASAVSQTLAKTERLENALSGIVLEQPWAASTSSLGQQLEVVAKVIKARGQLGTDRQTFFTTFGGFDTHSDVSAVLNGKFNDINAALTSFEEEMKLQGMWDDVVIVESSDFARTITSNGAGTDHGWGGNYFIVGGSVRGGTMIGEYPDDLTTNGITNIGRGRILPTMSWDEVWNGIAMWFGVEQSRMDLVLPNKDNFADKLLDAGDIFAGTNNPPAPKPVDDSTGIIVAVAVGVVGLAGLLLFAWKFPRGRLNGKSKSTEDVEDIQLQDERRMSL